MRGLALKRFIARGFFKARIFASPDFRFKSGLLEFKAYDRYLVLGKTLFYEKRSMYENQCKTDGAQRTDYGCAYFQHYGGGV
jgi:hypothetical protein